MPGFFFQIQNSIVRSGAICYQPIIFRRVLKRPREPHSSFNLSILNMDVDDDENQPYRRKR